MKQLSIFGLILFLFASTAYGTPKSELSAPQIINKMAAVYASCDSYIDEGNVTLVFIRQNGNRTVIKSFLTAFVRPSNFRFEYKDRRGEYEWNSFIIWKEGDSLKTWWTIKPEVQTPRDLNFATSSAAGISSLASKTIPGLLMPETINFNIFKYPSDVKLIGEEQINGSTVYKIEGTDFSNNTRTVWIDKEDLLVVKIFQKQKIGDFEVEATTNYKPQINVKIAEEKLAFNIPEKGK